MITVGSVRLSIDATRRASLYRLRRRECTPPVRIAWVEKRRSGKGEWEERVPRWDLALNPTSITALG